MHDRQPALRGTRPAHQRVLEAARRLGMHVLWCPTDAAGQYVGTPQRERAIAVEYVPAP